MDYCESSLFYPDFSPEDKVRLYSVFGGIPYYNRLIKGQLSVLEKLIQMEVVENRAPINDTENRSKSGYHIGKI